MKILIYSLAVSCTTAFVATSKHFRYVKHHLAESDVDAAMIDGSNCPDAGLQTSAEERAVMIASELKGVLPHRQNKRTRSSRHGMNLRDRPINRDELLQAEDSAAFEAHGCSDPGMEAAAMERAVLMASELHHPTKEKNTQSESTAQPNDSGASRSKINNLWVDSLFHQGHQGHRNAAEIDGDKTRTSDEEAERERLMNEIYFQMKSSQRVNFLGL